MTAAVSAWEPLRYNTFRSLWLAQLGANVGNWMQTVGAQWILLTHGAALVAFAQTAQMLPTLLLSLPAGALADIVDRRRLIAVTMTAMAAVMGGLTVVTATTDIHPWVLLGFTFAVGCGAALTSPAFQALQPELVPRPVIPAAATLSGMAVNVARALGPAIGGFLVALVGPALVFGINAVGFIGVAATAFVTRPPRALRHDAERMGPAMLAGLRYLRSAPGVRRIILRSALFAIPGSALWALLPVAATSHYGLGASGYGILLGVLGVGAVGGVVLLPPIRARLSSTWLLALSAFLFALATVAVGYLPLWAAGVILLVGGVAWIATLSTLNASVQLTLAGWVMARGMALYIVVFMGGQGVGALVWGLLADRIGYQQTLLVASVVLVTSAVSTRWLPLLPGTGTRDRTVVRWGEPGVVFDPEPADGPVLVLIAYHVDPADADAFIRAMRSVERSRRRTGATRWGLFCDGADGTAYEEAFVLPSWSEHLRQHTTRWTGADADDLSRARAFVQGEPVVRHLLAAGVDRTPGDDRRQE